MSAAACTPDIRAAAAALGGDVVGPNQILCPGPNHSPRDRSLSVTLGGTAGFIVNSFAGDTWQECRDHVRQLLNLPPPAEPKRSAPSPAARDNNTGRRALEIWRETVPLPGTPGEAYLASRGVRYDGDALRWHKSCPFSPGVRVGCMVGLVRNIVTNEAQAIHRTAIGPTGEKLSSMGNNGRLTLGPTRGGAVKLTDDAEVTTVIAIGEGIETTLSIRQMPDLELMPLWCTLNAGGILNFPVLRGIEAVWIAVDHDRNGTCQKAALSCAQRLEASGIEARNITPDTVGEDLNDKVVKP
jgi:putative DNA primase/helicase